MSELTETIDSINNQLVDLFGIDTVTGLPIWRVVWSEDQFEKRFGTYDDYSSEGLYIRTVTEVRVVPKYKQWLHDTYILERLVLVPDSDKEEMLEAKLSYEPIYPFLDKNNKPLPPKIQACKFIVDTIYSVQAVHKAMITGSENADRPLARYSDGLTAENARDEQEKRIKELENELFGDESSLMGTTIDCGSSIIVPHTFKEKN